MKSLFFGICLSALLLSACGQSGDLYLPDNPPPEVQKRQQKDAKPAEAKPEAP